MCLHTLNFWSVCNLSFIGSNFVIYLGLHLFGSLLKFGSLQLLGTLHLFGSLHFFRPSYLSVFRRFGLFIDFFPCFGLKYLQLVPPLFFRDNPINAVTTKFIRTSTNKIRCPIFSLAWTPDGRRLMTGASSGEFTLWNGLTFNFETILQVRRILLKVMIYI